MSVLLLNVEAEVNLLFNEAPDRHNPWQRTNPVTGARWVPGLDRIGRQKKAARRALTARARFAKDSPPDAPQLPLSYSARENLKVGGVSHLVAWYARSLEAFRYDYDAHPSFENYARGVMASEFTGSIVRDDPDLLKRYPPRPLAGLGPGLCWSPAPCLFTPSETELGELIERKDADLPDWFAPFAPSYLCVGRSLIDLAVACRRPRRLKFGRWKLQKPGVYFRRLPAHLLWVIEAPAHGWVIERCDLLAAKDEPEEAVLSHALGCQPVLCPDAKTAKLFADVCHPTPPDGSGLPLAWLGRPRR